MICPVREHELRLEFASKIAHYAYDKDILYSELEEWYINKLKSMMEENALNSHREKKDF